MARHPKRLAQAHMASRVDRVSMSRGLDMAWLSSEAPWDQCRVMASVSDGEEDCLMVVSWTSVTARMMCIRKGFCMRKYQSVCLPACLSHQVCVWVWVWIGGWSRFEWGVSSYRFTQSRIYVSIYGDAMSRSERVHCPREEAFERLAVFWRRLIRGLLMGILAL